MFNTPINLEYTPDTDASMSGSKDIDISRYLLSPWFKVGYQRRSDTVDGKLGFISFLKDIKSTDKQLIIRTLDEYTDLQRKDQSQTLDSNQALRYKLIASQLTKSQEHAQAWSHTKTWCSWIRPAEGVAVFENIPTTGFVINKTVKHWGQSNRNVLRVWDPRGFEIELSVENLFSLIKFCQIDHGLINVPCVYVLKGGSQLELLPIDTLQYQTLIKINQTQQTAKTKSQKNWFMHKKNGTPLLYVDKVASHFQPSLQTLIDVEQQRKAGFMDPLIAFDLAEPLKTFDWIQVPEPIIAQGQNTKDAYYNPVDHSFFVLSKSQVCPMDKPIVDPHGDWPMRMQALRSAFYLNQMKHCTLISSLIDNQKDTLNWFKQLQGQVFKNRNALLNHIEQRFSHVSGSLDLTKASAILLDANTSHAQKTQSLEALLATHQNPSPLRFGDNARMDIFESLGNNMFNNPQSTQNAPIDVNQVLSEITCYFQGKRMPLNALLREVKKGVLRLGNLNQIRHLRADGTWVRA